jgi:protoporphyrinogen oxidase
MKIGIIGAGFTGLAAGYTLTSQGHDVTIFERDSAPGGLAIGYQEKHWEWSLEKHYHHWFTNDRFVLELAKTIQHPVLIRRPKTSVYLNHKLHQLDSPKNVLLFTELSLIERLRMATILGLLRYNPVWKPLEKVRAADILKSTMGEKAYTLLWEPQFQNKFGTYVPEISLAWFWARITKRTPSLAYPEGGFLRFAEALVKKIKKQHGHVLFQTELREIHEEADKSIRLRYVDINGKEHSERFDKVIITTPSFLFVKLTPQLPESYVTKLAKLKGLGATNLVLRLKEPFFNDGTYWLSVCDTTSPVMAIVEHTNLMDRKHYAGEHLVYLGNYVPPEHEYFQMNEDQMLKRFDSFLKRINPDYKKHLIGMKLFKAPFAQPIIPINYSKLLPAMETPLKNVVLANIEQVYPWDRGTNYAVELGQKAARLVMN